jgi:SPP1 gp7 family putative phage head morphogenesis protein
MAAPLRMDQAEAAAREVALELFGTEADDVLALLMRVAASGLDLHDPIAQEAIRRIVGQYEPGGAYHEAWLDRYTELIGQTFAVAGRDVAATTGLAFNLRNPLADAAVERRAARLADLVGQGTADRISEAVTDALRDGGSMRDLAQHIRDDVFDGDTTDARAERIARTEMVGALNEGEWVSAKNSGVIAEKEWMTQGDERVRDSHAELDGVRIPLDEPFANGLMYPGDQTGDPSEIINCRCTLLMHSQLSDEGDGEDA